MSNIIQLQRIFLKVTLFILVVGMVSCTTKRKKNEISKVGKMFHNTTAKYNGYFNANELVEESITSLKQMNEDDYRFILPVYDYVSVSNPGPVAGDLDIAIQKVTTVTALHEPSHWVDDCYVLMGKAQYLKQDYEASVETLEYFEEQFDPKNPYGRAYTKGQSGKRKSKKEIKKERKQREKDRKEKDKEREKERKDRKKTKEQERKDRLKAREKARKEGRRLEKKTTPVVKAPDVTTTNKTDKEESSKKDDDKKKTEEKPGGMFKHNPAYYEGLFWLSRAFIEKERFTTAEQLLNKIEKATGATKDIKNALPAAKAHLYVKKNSYDKALKSLNEAYELSKNKDEKSRYNFIIAQIHEENGDLKKAFEGYDKSIKMSTNYNMAFNAKLNKIKASTKSGKTNSNQALRDLDKMLNDKKNNGYEGEIFFTKAELELENSNTEEALDNFKNALSYSGNSQKVKIEAYYKLATIFYNKKNFVKSKLYYDSTLAVMPLDDKRSFEVRTFSENLGDIVSNIEIVELQDSLLRLSKLSKEQQKEIAKKLIEEGALASQNQNTSRNTNPNLIKSGNRYGSTGKSSFFAYNPLARNQGRAEFKRTWGQRALEDNWRRSSRSDASDAEDAEEIVAEEGTTEISDAEVARIMADVPSNPATIEQSHRRLQEALMQLGILYRDRVQNYQESMVVLKRLIKDYPDYPKMDQALYYLYLSYKDLSKVKLANNIKNQLANNYPKSKFTKLANDPNYAKQLRSEENELETYYNKTLRLFDNGKYDEVVSRASEAGTSFGLTNPYAAKFALLSAMSFGSVKGKAKYILELQKLLKNYPNTPEELKAKEILRFLKGDKSAFDAVLYDEALSLFEKEPEALHYGLVVVYGLKKTNTDKVKINISNFNKEFHKLKDLKTSNIILDQEKDSEIILIRGFESEEKAMKYYESVNLNKKDFIERFNYDFFISTQKNFREVIKQKEINNYRLFFEKNYLNQD